MTGAGHRHSRRAAPALRALAEADPAIGALSLWCTHRDGAETRTRGATITYGPEFEALQPHERMGLAARHVLHVALRHSARLSDLRGRLGAGFDADLWTLCADALASEAVLAGEHALPRPAVTLTGLLEAALGETVAPAAALADWDVDRLYFALTAGDASGAADRARDYARRQAHVPDVEGLEGEAGGEDGGEEAARWRAHMARAMEAGRAAGRGLGRIGHRLADVPAPRTPWEVVLRRLLTAVLRQERSPAPTRPSRRWIAAAGLAARTGGRVPGFEPGTRPWTRVPRVAVALDASGSVDDARLALFWGEVTGIARRAGAEIVLAVFDDAVRLLETYAPGRAPSAPPEMPRGGGTAFGPPIAAARAAGATALVVLTDLDGEVGPEPKGMRVIWAVPDGTRVAPPWGRLVTLAA